MWRQEVDPGSAVRYVRSVAAYQDSTGRNGDAGGPGSAGFPPTYGFVDGIGLSGRA